MCDPYLLARNISQHREEEKKKSEKIRDKKFFCEFIDKHFFESGLRGRGDRAEPLLILPTDDF